jgi:hypothetical protein
MPILRNVRHERFARQLIHGMKSGRSRGSSYSAAGYKAEGESAEAAASRLLGNVKSGVAARVRELAGGGARRAEITAASLLEKLDRVYDGATEAKQFSAAGRAIEAQSKIAGVGAADRIEIGGPGDFGTASVDDTLKMVAREIGAETAMVFALALDHDGVMLVDEVARCMLKGTTLDQALESNSKMREAFLGVASDQATVIGPPPPPAAPQPPSFAAEQRSELTLARYRPSRRR